MCLSARLGGRALHYWYVRITLIVLYITQCYIYYYAIQKFEVSMIFYVIFKGTNNTDMYNDTKDLNKFCIL